MKGRALPRDEKTLPPMKLTEIETVYRGWTTLHRAKVPSPAGGYRFREIEDHGTGVAVLAYDPDRRVALLVRQHRPPAAFAGAASALLEAIAGIREPGPAEDCARREAVEEAGVELRDLHRVGEAWMMPGISTERVTFFLAEYRSADRVSQGGGVAGEGESIVAEELGFDAIAAHLAGEGPVDCKLLVLFNALRLHRPDLFA